MPSRAYHGGPVSDITSGVTEQTPCLSAAAALVGAALLQGRLGGLAKNHKPALSKIYR
jgi:hypothetical protein